MAQRVLKAKHVIKYGDQYDAYIIGGSKTGSYRASKWSELDGYRYYSFWEMGGNFNEYETAVKFLLENGSPKKIVLSISGGEVRKDSEDQEDLTFRLPAEEKGTSQLAEYISYLFKDPIQGYEKIRERETSRYITALPGGERNFLHFYRSTEYWEKRTRRDVLSNFDAHMKRLFTTDIKWEYYQSCLDRLANIKEMCEEAGVELLVVLAPSFIGEMSEHDSTYFRDYLVKMALITDYWDFSGYHDIDLNPWNFYNEGHFYYEISDAMVDTINGVYSYEGFGTYVTRANVMQQMAKRQKDYERLQQEYLETGTIRLFGNTHKSCLSRSGFELAAG